MKTIYINGKFLCQKVTGVQRVGIEIVKQFDSINTNDIKFCIITPSKEYLVTNLKLNNIQQIELKGKPNYYWEQIKLANYCKKNKPDDLLNFCNIAPILYPGSCFIHDLAWIDTPNSYSWKFRFVYNFIINHNIHKYKHIFTVSNVMKDNISKRYGINNVDVIYNSAEHMIGIHEEKPKVELPDEFYFSLGSANPNKNFKAIVELAKKNLDDKFVISGNKHKSFSDINFDGVKNVIFTGYLNDNEICYLYKHCKAFLFPSIYEGFGIPPLEAMICGCKNVICNDIPVLHELYDGYVDFINFDKIDKIDINDKNDDIDYSKLYSKFNWNKSALKVLEVLSDSKEKDANK